MNSLDSRVVLQSVLAELTSDTRLLVATEGDLRVKLVVAAERLADGSLHSEYVLDPDGT